MNFCAIGPDDYYTGDFDSTPELRRFVLEDETAPEGDYDIWVSYSNAGEYLETFTKGDDHEQVRNLRNRK